MSLGVINKGAVSPPWTVQVLRDDNSPVIITGGTVTGTMYERPTGSPTALTNSYSITDGPNGTFTYTPSTADVSVYGYYDIYWTVTIGALVYVVKDDIQIRRIP